LGLAVAAITVWSYEVPDAVGFQKPELARIFFWHFPSALLSSVLLGIAAWFSFRTLRASGARAVADWDLRAVSVAELGFVFAATTMATGILFSEVQWGTWWQWDPRQTSFLLVLLLYGAYFAVRGAFVDAQRRALNSAGYALAMVPAALFLIFVFPRLPQVAAASFHPTQSIWEGQIRGGYAIVTVLLSLALSGLCLLVYRQRVRAGLLLLELDHHGNLEDSRRSAPAVRVVRPLHLPSANPEDAERGRAETR
jgi:heme exporter protein C